MSFSSLSKRVSDIHHEHSLAHRQYESEKESRKTIRKRIKQIEKARTIVQDLAQLVQQQAHRRIAGVVSDCIRSVFGDVYDFRIDFIQKRGKTEAKLVLIKDGHDVDDPVNEDSGGVLSVCAFALRLACLVSTKPVLQRLMVLDEPFSHLSKQYREPVRDMLIKLSKEFQIQFIMVTHISELQCGKIITL